MIYKFYNLQLFGEAGGASASGTGGTGVSGADGMAENGLANQGDLRNTVYGVQAEEEEVTTSKKKTTQSSESDKNLEFENMIKGEYKDAYAKRVKAAIDERFKSTNAKLEKQKALDPILSLLADKYGVDAGDYEALSKAVQDDDSYYQQAAMDAGLTVKQYKEVRRLEQENKELLEAQQQAEARQQQKQIYSKWVNEGEQFANKYGIENFSLESESQNPDFTRLLAAGVSVEGAYKAIHFDDMAMGLAFKTANEVKSGIAKSIGQRASRPQEGGVMTQSATTFKTDVKSLTKADREEIERRVARGEVIRF